MRVFQTLLAFSGNAPPQLALTHRLVERGHQVRVLAHEAARERVQRTGAEFVPFKRAYPALDMTRPETDPLHDWDVRTRFGAGLTDLNVARAEHGLDPLTDWYDQLRTVQEIAVMSAPELDFSSRGQLAENVHYVG